jgi:UV DNA damage endonuclease
VIDSWRGVRPVIHYSVSREDCLVDFPTDVKPDMTTLLETGYKKAKLRAHSDYMWNSAVNDWALEFNDYADIMVESKCKNLASIALYKYSMEKNNELSKQDVRQKVAGPDPIII